MRWRWWWFASVVATGACTQLLGVDQDYEVGASGTGATGTATQTGTASAGAGGGGMSAGGTSSGGSGASAGGGAEGGGASTGGGGTGQGGAATPVFVEEFSSGDWPSADWLTETLGSNSNADVEGGWGRLMFGTASPAWARATCLRGPWTDADVTMLFRFNHEGTEGHFHTWLRAAGAFDGNSLPQSAYAVTIVNSSGAMSLSRISAGLPTVLASGAWTATPDVGTYRLRFQVRGSHLGAKVWPDGAAEPGAWTLQASDDAVAAAGELRLGYIKVSSARWVYVDDITLSAW